MYILLKNIYLHVYTISFYRRQLSRSVAGVSRFFPLLNRKIINLLGWHKLKRHATRPSQQPQKREIRSGIRSQVHRRQGRDVLKCRARKDVALISRVAVRRLAYRNFPGGNRRVRRTVEMEYRIGGAKGCTRTELSGTDDTERRVECNCSVVQVCARRHRQRHFWRDLSVRSRVSRRDANHRPG